MNAHDFEQQLSRFIEGDLSPAETQSFVRLLKDDPTCASRLLQELDFVAMLQTTLGKTDESVAKGVLDAMNRVRSTDTAVLSAVQMPTVSKLVVKQPRPPLRYRKQALVAALAASILIDRKSVV